MPTRRRPCGNVGAGEPAAARRGRVGANPTPSEKLSSNWLGEAGEVTSLLKRYG